MTALELEHAALSSRDEHADRLRSGPRAQDPGGGPASLPQVERPGQRHPYSGSREGERRGPAISEGRRTAARSRFVFKWRCRCGQDKAGPHKEIYPYVIQELRPTLDELGISTPEELGIDKL